jgi:hypothetical protein
MASLFHVKLNIPVELLPMINDVIRMGVIQIVAQFLFYATNSKENPFFSEFFLQTMLYLLIGVVFYWIIIRKLFIVEHASCEKEEIAEGDPQGVENP